MSKVGNSSNGAGNAAAARSTGGSSTTGGKATSSKTSRGPAPTGFSPGPTAAKEKVGFNAADVAKADLQAKEKKASSVKMDPASEAKLAKVNPELADRIRRTAADLKAKGIDVRVVSGYRSFAEQDALYAQGRTKPGDVVTKVKGGGSFHNYGLAVDLAPMKNGKVDWKAPESTWNAIGAAGKKQGLEWGGDWAKFKDRPHFQMTGGVKSASSYKALHAKEGLSGVWNKVNGNTAPVKYDAPVEGQPAPGAAPAPAGNTALPTAHLEKGYRSPQVKNLQDTLVNLGYMTRDQVNTGYGIFGPKTENAIRQFQHDNGLKVDGVVGPKTRAAFEKAAAGGNNPVAAPDGLRADTADAARINDILRGTNLAGKGQLIADLARKYDVPAEVALAMFRKEASFASPGTLADRNNNPGNIRFVGQDGAVKGAKGFAKWDTMDQGIEAYFKLMDKGYRSFIDNKDWSGLVNKYAPPVENDSRAYTNNIINWMSDYRNRIGG